MNKIILKGLSVCVLIICSKLGYSQIGIGTNNPDASAKLEINSTTKGFLAPRMTESQRNSIASPATGLLIFQTDNVLGFYYNIGDAITPNWVTLKGADGINGIDGAPGMTGPDGPMGPVGADGPQGAPGADGYTPVFGLDYFNGNDGYTPVFGLDYFNGNDGINGADGYTPVFGLDYFNGADGLQGPPGADGPVGPMGPQGPVGADGPVGPMGPQGPAGADGTSSDSRLKKDIMPITNGINTVMKLNPVTYFKKANIDSNDYSKHENGFIAQELREVIPFIVSEGKDKYKTLSVNYTSIIPLLTKGMQEQQIQLVEQAKEIALLKAQIAQLLEKK